MSIQTASELLESIKKIEFKWANVENELDYELSDATYSKYEKVQIAFDDLCDQLESEIDSRKMKE